MNPKLFWLITAILLVSVHPAEAQQPKKIWRIGFLDASTAAGDASLLETFRQEMAKFGWIEGKNIAFDYRYGEQKPERLPELAKDLVRLKADVILVVGIPAALAANGATSSIPIVMMTAGDPVGVGLVASLARPAGNVTGNSVLSPELNSKRLEILKDAIPKLASVGLLKTPPASNATLEFQFKETGLPLWH